MPQYWLVTTSSENFEVDRGRNFSVQGFVNRFRNLVGQVQSGDKLVVYIMEYFAFGEYGSEVAKDDQAYRRRLDVNADKEISIADIMEYFAFDQYSKDWPYGL